MARKKSQIELLRQYFQFGLGLMIAIAFALMSFNKFTLLLHNDLYYGIFSILLFVLTCIWFAGWIYFDHEELQYFEDYIDTNKFKRLHINPFISALLIALLCGILLTISDNLKYYIPLATVNFLIATIGYSGIHHKLLLYYIDIKNEKHSPTHELCEYYLHRPFYLVDTITILFLAIAYITIIISEKNGLKLYFYIAYCLTIITIFLHELILWSWRIRRDRKISLLEENE